MIIEKVRDYFNSMNLDTDALLKKLKEGNDTFFSTEACIEQLKQDYQKYGRIIVAYDFDDTIQPSQINYSCDSVVKLLQLCSEFNDIEMICYTARTSTNDIIVVKETLKSLGIKFNAINDDCPRIKREIEHTHASKVMFSVFLDNRAGLKQAYDVLVGFMEWYVNKPLRRWD